MKDYYDLFVRLSLKQCLAEDYSKKGRVAAHNRATKKLLEIQEEMKETDNLEDILNDLLDHGDDRVKINAAFFGIQTNLHKEKVRQVLNEIVDAKKDPTIWFSAKMGLQRMGD